MYTSIPQLYQLYLQQHQQVCTDTRKIVPGSIFFALKGPNFNANTLAAKALHLGAAFAVIDEAEYYTGAQTLLVSNTLEALQQLALHHRKQLQIPVLAITGSNGKTTTKELVHAVLSTVFTTSTTQGNLNNHIGIPLTLLAIPSAAQIAVIEMGANHQREIAGYCTYTLPSHGLITNCGKAHLEGFGGVEGVRKGKGELFDHLRATRGQAFICNDFEYFKPMSQGLENPVWYGTMAGEVVAAVIEAEPFLKVQVTQGFENSFTIETKLVGAYNIYNVLAALTIGRYFNVPAALMQSAIQAYTPDNQRSQLIEKGGNHIILDSYNANPTSMAAAIENFARLHVPNKWLFLGAMMEMGADSLAEHAQLIALIEKYNWAQVVLVGGDFAHVPHSYLYFNNAQDAAQWWKAQQLTGQYLLVKGSRSMKMETIVA